MRVTDVYKSVVCTKLVFQLAYLSMIVQVVFITKENTKLTKPKNPERPAIITVLIYVKYVRQDINLPNTLLIVR